MFGNSKRKNNTIKLKDIITLIADKSTIPVTLPDQYMIKIYF